MIRESQTAHDGRTAGSDAPGGIGSEGFRTARAADPSGRGPAAPPVEPDVFAPVRKHLKELYTFATHYAATQADRFKLQLRNAVLVALLGVAGMVAITTAVAYSMVVLITGIAHGLTALFGPEYLWAAELLTGAGILFAFGLGAWGGLKSVTNTCLATTMRKYERRRAEERATLGKEVDHQGNEHA